jgi:hypothetical protein
MKLLKNLKTGICHYVINDITLCKIKSLNPEQWIEVNFDLAKPYICYNCDGRLAEIARLKRG